MTWTRCATPGSRRLPGVSASGTLILSPVRWDCEVEVFGRKVCPGQLIHADKHGFLAIPDEDQVGLLDAARFMDANECNTLIPAARSVFGKPAEQILTEIDAAGAAFDKAAREKFGKKGEW